MRETPLPLSQLEQTHPLAQSQRRRAEGYRERLPHKSHHRTTRTRPTQLNYRYEIYNHTAAAQRKNRLDPERREYNTDRPVPVELPVISKDTAFINEDGEIVRQTVTRPLTGDYDSSAHTSSTSIPTRPAGSTTSKTPTTSHTPECISPTQDTTTIPS